jgi:hypothetical protein
MRDNCTEAIGALLLALAIAATLLLGSPRKASPADDARDRLAQEVPLSAENALLVGEAHR